MNQVLLNIVTSEKNYIEEEFIVRILICVERGFFYRMDINM